MTRAEAGRLLSSMPPEEVDKIFEVAKKTLGQPKSQRHTEKSTGVYNAVALPEPPERVIAVKDAGKAPLEFGLTGQQAICSRTLLPPVIIEYITKQAAAAHDAKIATELEKLRLKG